MRCMAARFPRMGTRIVSPAIRRATMSSSRRYTADQLRSQLATAGFLDIDVRYFDAIGVIPYWLMYRAFNVARLDRVSSTGYDRVIVPISRVVQALVRRPPRGKNLVATARWPAPR